MNEIKRKKRTPEEYQKALDDLITEPWDSGSTEDSADAIQELIDWTTPMDVIKKELGQYIATYDGECPKCNEYLRKIDKYCPECGQALQRSTTNE